MPHTQNPYEKMRQNNILTTPKEELTLMLYDGALKFVNQAIAVIEAGGPKESANFLKANELIIRVQDIIREFQLTLNKDYEVSAYFASIYDYIYRLLVEGNIRKDTVMLGEARDLIREFRDMWKEAMVLARTKSGK